MDKELLLSDGSIYIIAILHFAPRMKIPRFALESEVIFSSGSFSPHFHALSFPWSAARSYLYPITLLLLPKPLLICQLHFNFLIIFLNF